MLKEVAQLFNQLLAAVTVCAPANDALSHVKHLRRHDCFEGTFLFDPLVCLIDDAQHLELERDPVEHVVADVLFVGQHFVHGGPGPVAPQVGAHALLV